MSNENTQNNGQAGDEPESHRKLFIGGLSPDTTDDSLNKFYSQWGEVTDAVVMKDPTTKRSRCFGFVTYKRKGELDEAQKARPHVIDGKQVDPKRAVPREEGQRGEANVSTTRVYLSNIKETHTEDMLKEHFTAYGNVTKVDIITDKQTNKPRGFAFITFEDYDSVDQAVLAKHHQIGGYRCDAKKGLNKDEMAKAQQNRERLDRGARSRGMGRTNGGGGGRGGYGGAVGGGYGGYGGGRDAGGYGGGYGGAGYGQQAAGGWGDAPWGAPAAPGWGAQAPAAAAWGAAPAANQWNAGGNNASGWGGQKY